MSSLGLSGKMDNEREQTIYSYLCAAIAENPHLTLRLVERTNRDNHSNELNEAIEALKTIADGLTQENIMARAETLAIDKMFKAILIGNIEGQLAVYVGNRRVR